MPKWAYYLAAIVLAVVAALAAFPDSTPIEKDRSENTKNAIRWLASVLLVATAAYFAFQARSMDAVVAYP